MDSNATNTITSAGIPAKAVPARFSKNVATTFVTRIVMVSGGLATSIIVARWLGASGLGVLTVINVTVALAVQIGCAGIPSANTYFISRNRNDLPRAWTNSMVFALVAGVLILVALVVITRSRPSMFGVVPVSLITLAAFSIPFQLLTLIGLNVFLSVGQLNKFNLTDASTQLVLLLNAILALILLGFGLGALVALNTFTMMLTGSVIAVLVSALVRTVGAVSRRFDWEFFKRTLRYGIKFHICVVAGIVIIRADLLLVNHFRGSAEAGVYAVAGQMGNLLLLLPGTIATLLFPRVASDPDPRGDFTARVTRYTAFIMFLICLAAAAFSFALPLIYGSAFRPATLQLLILLPGVYLMAVESVMVQHFTGTGLPGVIPVFWAVCVLFSLTLNVILIPSYGATSAAVVSTLTYALIFVLVAIYFRLKTGNGFAAALLMQRDEMRELLKWLSLSSSRTYLANNYRTGSDSDRLS